ncbi:MAG TPA: LacI family DNA-binding transcriptional regulator [Jatrophihabitantaceae bacterium]|jgi:LacI family transcriptional regulator|nr:LacI family DNA-binding transcriptional regulator [Jatrophihabitantaceae bacterium]
MASYSSLKDVAARAGVSFQTASKVLNGHPGAASADTIDRVVAAARDLEYVPSAMARRLVSRSAPLVGIITGDLSDTGLAQFLAGALRGIHARGGEAFIVALEPARNRDKSVRKLLEQRVDGVVVIAPSVERERRFARAFPASLPMVSINHLPGSSATLVGSDHHQTGTLAATHLLELGHREIATVTGPSSREVVGSRHAGFQDVLKEAGIQLPTRRVARADWSAQEAHRATAALLDADSTVTAIFVHSDVMAMGVLSALRERGCRVPDDVSVVGCDDMAFSAFLAPPLTTVRVPFEQTGQRAAELLLAKISRAEIPHRELLPVQLIERRSTGPPPTPFHGPRRTRAGRSGTPLQLIKEGSS